MKTNTLLLALCLATVAGCAKDEGTASVPVTSVSVSPADITITAGETCQLTATVLPENADDRTVIWTSSDTDVAEVSQAGLVTALNEGTAEITATASGITASCALSVKAAELPAPETGDFYYSDGTWSGVLDPGKTVAGIVFYSGDITAQDPLLKEQHPECTHGLAVSVHSLGESAWQSNVQSYGATIYSWVEANSEGFTDGSCQDEYESSDNLNKALGYNNTKAIEAFNAGAGNALWKAEAVESIAGFSESHPAPAKSSGWYLPSAKELSLLCSGQVEDNIYDIYGENAIVTLVNQKIAEAGFPDGTIQPELHWSSTEWYSYSYATEVSMKTGSVGYASKAGGKDLVRYILAF